MCQTPRRFHSELEQPHAFCRYEDAQQHDPSVKYAVVIFYLLLVSFHLP